MGLLDRVEKVAGKRPKVPTVNDSPSSRPAWALEPHLLAVRDRVTKDLIGAFAAPVDEDAMRSRVKELIETNIAAGDTALTSHDVERIVQSIVDDLVGAGPLQPLLRDPDIQEVFVNSPEVVHVQYHGMRMRTDVRFADPASLERAIVRLMDRVGRSIGPAQPIVEVRLESGTRICAVLPPLAIDGPCLYIGKLGRQRLGPDYLVKLKSISGPMLGFLRSCVRAGLTCLVIGPPGSGVTTFLNTLASFIAEGERVVVCEEADELEPTGHDFVGLAIGRSGDLMEAVRGLRPSRVVIGALRASEVLDALVLMRTVPVLVALNALGVRDGLALLSGLAGRAGAAVDGETAGWLVASGVNLVIHVDRIAGGPRRVMCIAEVTGSVDGDVGHQDIFRFIEVGRSAETGKAVGYHSATGVVPACIARLEYDGEAIDRSVFEPTPPPPAGALY